MSMVQLETNGASNGTSPDATAEVEQAIALAGIADTLVLEGAEIGTYVIPAFSNNAGFSIEQWLSMAIGTAFPLFLQPPSVAIGYICDAIRLQTTFDLDEREAAIIRIYELQQCGRTLSKAENMEVIELQRVVKNAAGAFEKEHGDANKKARRDAFWTFKVQDNATEDYEGTACQRELDALLETYSAIDDGDAAGIKVLAAMLLKLLEVNPGEFVRFDKTLDSTTIAYGKVPQPLEPFGGLKKGVMFFQKIDTDARHHWNADEVSGRDAIAAWCGADESGYNNSERPNLMQAMKRRQRDAMQALGLDECTAVWNGQREDVEKYSSSDYAAVRIQYREPDGQKRERLSKWLYCGTKDKTYSLSNVFKNGS